MNRIRIILMVILSVAAVVGVWATMGRHGHEGKNHDHGAEDHAHESDQGHDDKEEHGHDEGGEDHDDHGESGEEEAVGGIGAKNAVTAADEHEGIKLSPKAIETMGIRTMLFAEGLLTEQVFVKYQDRIGVYRLRDGWFKLVPLCELEPGDSFVTEGMGLLRAAELDAFSQETGHSH